jgi:hypothetical protein
VKESVDRDIASKRLTRNYSALNMPLQMNKKNKHIQSLIKMPAKSEFSEQLNLEIFQSVFRKISKL